MRQLFEPFREIEHCKYSEHFFLSNGTHSLFVPLVLEGKVCEPTTIASTAPFVADNERKKEIVFLFLL